MHGVGSGVAVHPWQCVLVGHRFDSGGLGQSGHVTNVGDGVARCSGHTGQGVLVGIASKLDTVGQSGQGVLVGHTDGFGQGSLVGHVGNSGNCGHSGQGNLVGHSVSCGSGQGAFVGHFGGSGGFGHS